MDPEALAIFEAQQKQQQKEYESMMKQFGMDVPQAATNEEAELAAIMKQHGIKQEGPQGEDALMAELGLMGNQQDMTDEQLLAQIDAGIIKEGKQLKKKMDDLVKECRALRDAKKIPEAQVKFKEYNAAKKEYEAYIAEHPEHKADIEKTEEVEKPQQQVAKAPVKKTLTTDELMEVYEKYHNTDPVKSFKVIENEIERMNQILKSTTDESLTDYYKGRIEMLEFSKESMINDAQNGMMSQDDYKNMVVAYDKWEKENYKKAKKDGLDLDNMKIIELRLGWLKEEFKEMEERDEEEEEEEEEQEQPEQAVQQQPASVQQEVPEQKPVNPEVIEILEARQKEYTAGVTYCMKVTKNLEQAQKMLEHTENLKQYIEKYKKQGGKVQLPPAITQEMIFGMTNEQRMGKFKELSDDYKKKYSEYIAISKKCADGVKSVKTKKEKENLTAIYQKNVALAKEEKAKFEACQKAGVNPWQPPPVIKEVASTALVPKINEDLQEDEFQVEITDIKNLSDCGCKSIKVKMENEGGKELKGHYFYPDQLTHEDSKKKIILIPPEYEGQALKKAKLHVAVKKSKLGMFEENMFAQEIPFAKLVPNNEYTKTFKFEPRVQFDITIRIRQALSGQEKENKKTTRKVMGPLDQAFDVFKQAYMADQKQVRVAKEAQEEIKKVAPPEPSSIPKKPAAQPQAPVQKPPGQGVQKIGLPQGIDHLDVENPEHEGLVRSITYCEHRLKQINALMEAKQKKGERLSEHEKTAMRNCTMIKAQLMSAWENGQLDESEYKAILVVLARKDKALALYYNQLVKIQGDTSVQWKLDISKTRYSMVLKEIKELP